MDRQGGGVAILARSDLKVTNVHKFTEAEAIQVDIELKNNKKLTIINVYRSPRVALEKDFLEKIFTNNSLTLIVGDFNAHHSLWYSRTQDKEGTLLADLAEEAGYILLNKKKHNKRQLYWSR